jgi:aminopeptidase N
MLFKKPIPILLFFLLLNIATLTAQNHTPRFNEIDIQHYIFNLKLNDTTDIIEGKAIISIKFLKAVNQFQLDLKAKDESAGKGMFVQNITENDKEIAFQQDGEKLNISPSDTPKIGDVLTFTIEYKGVPTDGLIISKNIFGDRTFFGDNWPDRAHHWLPTVDHPSDKATVEFIVTAPNYYQIIANGEQVEETNLDDDTKLTHWKEAVPLPTKVMVIGAARFAVQQAGYVKRIPVTSWVYPQNREAGFGDYELAVEVLDWFYKKMGSYPFEKLANVQSKTRYGGMENAGNIFYFEESVNGNKDQVNLIAHEIAHQWFGNSASELNWHHIWLSEGFATYMTDLFIEETKGDVAFKKKLYQERQKVIDYSKVNPVPIINTAITNYNQLLNPNSYQKGAWVLHMLRKEIGGNKFWKGIRKYYETYKFSNALSEDFQKVMEQVSGKNLDYFFKQWLYFPGQPQIAIEWTPIKKKKLSLTVNQLQSGQHFIFPLELELTAADGKRFYKKVQVNSKNQTFTIKVKAKIKSIRLDPNDWLLFEEID